MAQSTATTTDWAARAASLEETSGKFWKPQPGDAIGGELVAIEHNTGQKSSSTIYTIRTQDSDVVSFWGSAVLDKHLAGAKVGDVVLVKYFGMKQNAKGTEYKSFGCDVIAKEFKDDVPF